MSARSAGHQGYVQLIFCVSSLGFVTHDRCETKRRSSDDHKNAVCGEVLLV